MAPGSQQSPRCLIVDDHPVVRAGVRAVLESSFREPRVTDAATIEEAAETVDGDPPDVVVIDPWRAGVDVAQVVERLKRELRAPIVIFTSDGGARC